jgi:large subunit ribosomal protein L6
MSRIGKAPIPVPDGVDITITGQRVTVKGPKGELSHELPAGIEGAVDGDVITITRADDHRITRSLHGLSRALVNNMVVGVTDGYTKELQIVGVGYRAEAREGRALEMALGFSHPVRVEAPEGVEFETPEPTRILVRGIDKQLVGQVAADIRAIRKPEPYKGKGIRYANEYVARKAGKAAK